MAGEKRGPKVKTADGGEGKAHPLYVSKWEWDIVRRFVDALRIPDSPFKDRLVSLIEEATPGYKPRKPRNPKAPKD